MTTARKSPLPKKEISFSLMMKIRRMLFQLTSPIPLLFSYLLLASTDAVEIKQNFSLAKVPNNKTPDYLSLTQDDIKYCESHMLLGYDLSPTLDREFILQTIIIDDAYKKKLSSDQIQKKRAGMLNFIMEIAEDPYFAHKIARIIQTKNFNFVISENIEGNPYIVGMASYYRNKVFLKDKTTYSCSDYHLSAKHEINHHYYAALRSQDDPILLCKDLPETVCDEMAGNPFTAEAERQALASSLKAGKKKVTTELAKLHKKRQKGWLMNETEIAQYNKYTAALDGYQPRCIAHMIPEWHSSYGSSLKALKKNAPIDKNGVLLYPLYFEYISGGIVVFGNFVKNVDNVENRVSCYIKDTRYVHSDWIALYGSKETELATKELDAEISADHSKITRTFYPEFIHHQSLFYRKVDIQKRSDTNPLCLALPKKF